MKELEEKKIVELIERKRSIEEVRQMSPLTWAYVGDSVYEIYIRTYLTNTTHLKPHELHIKSIKYVKARAQSDILQKLDGILTQEEKDIVRRGRNTKNNHIAKNASVQDYMYSTAFEALIGYLYLTKQDDRLNELLTKSVSL